MLDFLSATYGSQKIVLYSVDQQMNSGTAILSKCPEISVGDELGSIGKQVLFNSKKGYNYLIHVGNDEESETREKICYYLIRDSSQAVIGILMTTIEIDYLIKLKKNLDQMLGYESIENRPVEFNDLYHELETDSFSLSKYAADIISNIIAESQMPIQRMTMDEKAQIVHRLDKLEIFNLKGAAKEATSQLLISPATLYRLLKRTE